jgi:DNA-binding NtrC family response regulator
MAGAIVILQHDPVRAEGLAAAMKSVSSSVKTVTSVLELRKFAARATIGIGVLDLELVTLPEITHLRQQLGMEIVCTHHAPDDAMWSAALGAGATDCCFVGDAPGICRAIQKSMAA